ncbi:MAG: helix-turn-helix domain-containing protein [Desulfobacterales bacterium]|nr:helix-turn-helix domain-containing protein [Desulfobacterales bacterium]
MELKTISEMASILRVPKSWLYAKTRQKGKNTIPCLRVGKYLRFRSDAVLAWIERDGD